MKNPLRPYYIFFFIAGAIYSLPLINELLSGCTFAEMITNHKVIVIFLCLCTAFIVCYLRKSIAAYWIAMFCYFIIFVSRIIIKNSPPDTITLIACVAVYLFLYAYLYPKYDIYKEFLINNGKGCTKESEDNEAVLLCTENVSDHRNPLELVFYITIFSGTFSLYNLFTGGGVLARSDGALTAYSQQITTLLVILAFGLCYWKKSIFAWWIALFGNLVIELMYYVFQPFKIPLIILSLFIYAFVVWYLIIKYRPYNEYITQQRQKQE